MHILDKDIKTKNMEQLEEENFYAKLINLKKEHENHMKQMENIYQSGKYKDLSPNRNSNRNKVTQTSENKVNFSHLTLFFSLNLSVLFNNQFSK